MPCINLGEAVAFVGGKVLKHLHFLHYLPPFQSWADPRSAQLWEKVHFRELIPALLLDFLHFLPRRDRFRDEPDARSEPFLVLATVCLRLSVLSI